MTTLTSLDARIGALLAHIAAAVLLAGCPDKSDDTDDASGSATTDESMTSTTPTTGADTGGQTGACQAACEHLVECKHPDITDVAACTASCMNDDLPDEPPCNAARDAYWSCVAGAACSDVIDFPAESCGVQYFNYLHTCAGCQVAVESPGPAQCGVIGECPDGTSVAFVCGGGDCRCQGDEDEAVKAWPAANSCAGDEAALRGAAAGCCGFAL